METVNAEPCGNQAENYISGSRRQCAGKTECSNMILTTYSEEMMNEVTVTDALQQLFIFEDEAS